MTGEITERVALITGAGRGSGREIARAFASIGTVVAVNDINPLNLDETVEQIRQAGGNAQPYLFDISKRMPIEGMIAQVLVDFGRIDILVNHASVYPDAFLLEMDEWEFHRTLDVNLAGAFFMMQQVARVMQQKGGGTILNLISSVEQDQFKRGHTAITASQAGLIGLTRSAAAELAAYHIQVNAVCHGPDISGMVHPACLDKTVLIPWSASHPQLWLGDHPDLVSTVLYLCSQEASTVTGKIITLDSQE